MYSLYFVFCPNWAPNIEIFSIYLLYTYMDLDVIKLRNNLNTFTLEELKKEVTKMKLLNFAVTHMKPAQVINLIINYRNLSSHLMNKTCTKKVAKPPKPVVARPASVKLPIKTVASLRSLAQQALPKPKW